MKIMKIIVKKTLNIFGINAKDVHQKIAYMSIIKAQKQQALSDMGHTLSNIVPDISKQESRENQNFNAYRELKRRTLQAFQCKLMIKALEGFASDKLTVVDIGDSAGTHMLYLKELTKDKFNVETISINLDPRAIEKIRARGLNAILKRAEDIKPEEIKGGRIDLFTSFEMVEHLHNPAIFFRRIAKNSSCRTMLITVPYLRQSRVGLYSVRSMLKEIIYAEDEHIFELNPEDWTLLFLHSGWKVTFSKIYYQYPTRWPFLSSFLRWFWKTSDFEGFWGAILEKETTFSDLYKDWEE
jgi:2-polyprenyl-3-methyl-5-hydroxy-6-metoxy-1,4-benzoquinol methylase